MHELSDASALIKLYAMISRMRTLSSRETVEGADELLRAIIKTYHRPNKSLTDLQGMVDRAVRSLYCELFGEAARQEFQRLAV